MESNAADEPSPFSMPPTVARPVVEHVTVTDENRIQKWLIAILVPYSVMMTVFAFMFYMKSQNTDALHPLSIIPDLDGEYRNATERRKATSEYRIRIPPGTALAASQITKLGQPIIIGDLEVTPLKIEQAPIIGVSLRKGTEVPETKASSADGLIMSLRLRNISSDVTFYPTDPFFVRRPRDEKDRPYMMIELGNKRFYGGALSYVTDSDFVIREWVQGQDNDHLPLKPGESRETVVCTSPKESVIDAIQSTDDQAVWRIQFRRGFVTYQDKEYSVSAVIGVTFHASDIMKRSDSSKS